MEAAQHVRKQATESTMPLLRCQKMVVGPVLHRIVPPIRVSLNSPLLA